MFGTFLLSCYFVCLIMFSFVSQPIVSCLFLVGGALCVCGLIYFSVGFGWYLLVFCLVYIGGVLILFIYVSLFSPNSFSVVGVGYVPGLVSGLLLFFFFSSWVVGLTCFGESGHYICSMAEGLSYCFFCVVFLFGFSVVSLVSASKDYFFR